MRLRTVSRHIPKRANYLRATLSGRVPGHQEHVFRIPQITTAAALGELVQRSASVDTDNPTALGATLLLEAGAALVGVAWFHPMLDLEVDWRDFPGTPQGLLEYGGIVSEEMQAGVGVPPEYGVAYRAARALEVEERNAHTLAEAASYSEGGEEEATRYRTLLQEVVQARARAMATQKAQALRCIVEPYTIPEISELYAGIVRPILEVIIDPRAAEERSRFFVKAP